MLVVQYVADFNLGFSLCGLFIPLGFCPQRFFSDPFRAGRDLNFLFVLFLVLALGDWFVISLVS